MMTTITTRLGVIEGATRNGVEHFLGIRYAEAPVGDRRFLPPVPSGAWEGTFEATAFPNRAWQPPAGEILGPLGPGEPDEDCLFLNVVTPAADGARRPVMCWIHGGAYTTGSANDYDGSILAAQGDVVVVTVNYRLGVFGFLDMSGLDSSLAGSASNGFRDQIVALTWIRDNIAYFGGDPDNVTIFGESAGGGSVLALIASPAADGLYHKAIAHSPGGVNTPPVDHLPAIDAQLAGDEPLLERMRAAPADRLIEIQNAIGFAGGNIDCTVVTRHPVNAIAERAAKGVPIIAGSNLDEGTLFSAIFSALPGMFEAFTPNIALEVTRGADPSGYLATLRERHPDDDDTTASHRVWVDLFRRTAVEVAEVATTAGPGGWLYRFDVPTTVFGGALGATHAAEIAFTFNWLGADRDVGITFHDRHDPALRDLARRWSDTVLAFARTGDPNGAGLPRWDRYTTDERECLILDGPSRIELDPDGDHRELWK